MNLAVFSEKINSWKAPVTFSDLNLLESNLSCDFIRKKFGLLRKINFIFMLFRFSP